MGKAFFESIVQGYDKCEKLDLLKNRFIRIDASRDIDDIFADVLSKIKL